MSKHTAIYLRVSSKQQAPQKNKIRWLRLGSGIWW